jgi:hypothetical protein
VLSQKVDADEFSVEVSYGPDGDAAEAIYDDGLDDVTGVIAKGLPQLGSVPLPRIDAGMLNGLYAALLADGKKVPRRSWAISPQRPLRPHDPP